MTGTRIVVALGGNAAAARDGQAEIQTQRHCGGGPRRGRRRARARDHTWQRPQVGCSRSLQTRKAVSPYPLTCLAPRARDDRLSARPGAEERAPGLSWSRCWTQAVVDPADPALLSHEIGPVYSEREARELARKHNWAIARDGAYFRRVVPSPEPRGIVELEAIELLVESGAIVVCCGGGGVPVVEDRGRLRGAQADGRGRVPRARQRPGCGASRARNGRLVRRDRLGHKRSCTDRDRQSG